MLTVDEATIKINEFVESKIYFKIRRNKTILYLLKESLVENKYGWYFRLESEEYLKDKSVGNSFNSAFFIDNIKGDIYKYSAYSIVKTTIEKEYEIILKGKESHWLINVNKYIEGK